MNFDYTIIGKRIRDARELSGYTQEQLAEFLDVSNAYISRIERGKTKINLDTLGKISNYLNIDPTYILSGTLANSENYLRDEVSKVLDKCSPTTVNLILEVIKVIAENQSINH